MRAVLCREFGPVETLKIADVPAPAIAPGRVRVAVHAVGVNFADLLIVQGKYQEKPPLPFSPGFEVAGVVTELGPGVEGLRLRDRIEQNSHGGDLIAFASQVAIDAIGHRGRAE